MRGNFPEEFEEFAEKIGEYTRILALETGDIEVHSSFDPDIDAWEMVHEADLVGVKYAHGDLHVWLEKEFTVSELEHSGTWVDPPAYKQIPHLAFIDIIWDISMSDPNVDIEFEIA